MSSEAEYDRTNITTITSLHPFFPYSDGVFIFLAILNIAIIFVAIVGNCTVIYASKIYHAIKIDKTSLIFLENLAYADILIAIVFYVPITVTLISRRWVLGKELCFVNAFFTSTPSIAEILILTAISIHRCWAVRNPFDADVRSHYVHCLIAILWLVALIPPAVWLILNMFSYYDPHNLSCVSSVYTDPDMTSVAAAGSVLLVGLPLLMVVVCNIYLLYVSITHNKRMGQSLSRVALITITIICWTFVISWLPFVLKVILNATMDTVPDWIYIVQIEVLGLNVTLNPVIYTVTNRRFRDFLIRTVFRRRTKPQHYLNRSFSGNRELNVNNEMQRMSAFSSSSPSPNRNSSV